jgi:hypothetical protein
MLSVSADASEKEMRRIVVGLKLFPSVVAADYLIAEKKDDKGYLPLYILHEDNPDLAQDLARQLRQIKQINNIPVKVTVLTFDEFVNEKAPSRVAAFLAQSPDSRTHEIVGLAISSSILLFSPFKGDVENGVHSGIVVSDRILPYVNLNTFQQSGIKLKAFFLRVAKHYD